MIPQQSGKISVDNWSSLSKTQKKRLKAKSKINTEPIKEPTITKVDEKIRERFHAVYDDEYIEKCINLVKRKWNQASIDKQCVEKIIEQVKDSEVDTKYTAGNMILSSII